MNPTTLAVFIGRMQPFHIGHQETMRMAFSQCSRLLVLVGSTGCAPSYRNPWNFEQIKAMIAGTFPQGIESGRLIIREALDDPYNDEAWAKNIRALVEETRHSSDEVTLYGHNKDESSFYLGLFPEWGRVDPGQRYKIDATEIRKSYFEDFRMQPGTLPPATWEALSSALDCWYQGIRAEATAIAKHDAEWDSPGARKYGVQHTAVDLFAHHREKGILLIRRGGEVGKGTLAMPGGFVNTAERLLPAVLREALEEIGIAIPVDRRAHIGPAPLLCFDHPRRSMRGRIFTHVLQVGLRDSEVEQVKAGDDAAEIVWVKPQEINALRGLFFSDHFHIVKYLAERQL